MGNKYCCSPFVAALVASLLALSNGVRVKVASNGSQTFNVIDYGAAGDGKKDDTQAFLKAWTDVCGASGDTTTLLIPGDKTFLLTSIAFLGPCKSTSVHVNIQGTIIAPDSIERWGKYCEDDVWVSFKEVNNLIVDGQGLFDGKGSIWWKSPPTINDGDKKSFDNDRQLCSRPTILRFFKCNALQLKGISTKDSPGAHIRMNESNNSTISNIHLTAPENSPNTDGIDISSTSQLHIFDSVIETGDDCIAINSDNSFINITGLTCGPGHGISVGSIGKDGEVAKVEEIHVRNCTFKGSTNGARIKTWQGGAGYARKITFDDIPLIDVQNPIIIDQYYCPEHNCPYDPKASAVAISDVSYSNFHGTSASLAAINLNCSNTVPCSNIVLDNINITPSQPSQKVTALCQNVKGNEKSVVPAVPCL